MLFVENRATPGNRGDGLESSRMFTDADLAEFAPRPFWFVSPELLADVLRAEIKAIVQLFAKHPDLCKLFEVPETTIPQRTVCFELLAHRKIVETVDEAFLGRYQDPPALDDEESNALRRTQNLVTSDATAWVLEMNEVAEWLPVRIHSALPEPLREEGFYRNDPARDAAVRSAANTLSTVEQIQALTARVFDEQLQRLRKRWSATLAQAGGPKRPKHWLKGFHGLGPKVTDLSEYMLGLTERQYMAFSLKNEFELKLSEIASRMGLARKTVSEHLYLADKKINQAYSGDRRKAIRAKNAPD